MAISDKFTTTCSQPVANSYNSCGTITRTSLKSLSPSQLADVFQDGSGNYRDMLSILKSSFELKSCGIKRNGLYDFLMSGAKARGKYLREVKSPGSDSFIEPYIFGRQKSIINDDFWAISTGYATGSYTVGVTGPLADLTGGTRVVRVISRYSIDLATEFFTPGGTVHIFGKSGSTAQRGQWKIIRSAIPAGAAYADVLLADQNGGSTTPFSATPIAGFLVIGTNNVSDYESWCSNRPALNPNKLVPFWHQTSRMALCVDSHYKEFIARASESNDLFALFGDVPLAERNKQTGERFQKEFVNSVFWGKAISSNQTVANYTSLDAITSVGGTTMGYRANAVGIYEQLRTCGQVYDLQNQQLNLDELFLKIYDVVRVRKNLGQPAQSVDLIMPSDYAAAFKQGMITYYNTKMGGLARFNVPITDGDIDGMRDLGFYATSYKLDYPAGVTINVITHEYFDDILNAADTESVASSGRFIWIIDWSTVYVGLVGSNRVVTTVDEIELLRKVNTSYSCVMSNPTRDLTLTSKTWTVVVECPSASLIIENFNPSVPSGTGLTHPYDIYNP